jgi:hypothetical protein
LRCNVGVTDRREYGVEMASGDVVYVASFIKTEAGVQAILRFSSRNLRGWNVGITNRRDL